MSPEPRRRFQGRAQARTRRHKAGQAPARAAPGAKVSPTTAQRGRAQAAAAGTADAASRAGQADERIRTLDFSQPTKFTTEIRRRISGAIEQFCEALSGRLTNELAVEVELSVAEVDQHTWAAAKARLAADAVAVAVEAEGDRAPDAAQRRAAALAASARMPARRPGRAGAGRASSDRHRLGARARLVRWDRRRAVERLGRARRSAADARRGRFGGRRRRLCARRRAHLRGHAREQRSTASRPRCPC